MSVVKTAKVFSKTPQCILCFVSTENNKATILTKNKSLTSEGEKLFKAGKLQKPTNTAISYSLKEASVVVYCVVGKDEEETKGESLRRAVNAAIKSVAQNELVEIDLSDIESVCKATDLSEETVLECVSETIILATYKFDKYITEKDNSAKSLKKATVITEAKGASGIVLKATTIASFSCFTRDLQNEPSNYLDSTAIVREARKAGKNFGFSVSVLDKKKIIELKMGGLLGVNAGSASPPAVIIAKHTAGKAKKTVLLVGKGVTFDSGGISIKPSANMAEMKMDMSGAAAVLGTMASIASLGLNLNVIGITPLTDNKPDAKAQNPGDILKTHHGLTVEVDNTDAEGRLILADALSYGIKTYKPDLVIDLATLTGACVIALGYYAAGVITNTQKAYNSLKEAGEETAERVWALPAFGDYASLIKSDIADVKNVGGRAAGTITAGKFLEKFVGKTPWIHIDIAGTAIMESAFHYTPKGGSGFGVRLLTRFLEKYAAGKVGA